MPDASTLAVWCEDEGHRPVVLVLRIVGVIGISPAPTVATRMRDLTATASNAKLLDTDLGGERAAHGADRPRERT